MADRAARLERLLGEIRACRRCIEAPAGAPLGHEPRPVLRVSTGARIGVFGQAPGTRVHASGVPFSDPSGVRLRQWMGVDDATFYDTARVAVVPMGFCFPGLDAKGGDRPPRRECAPLWRERVMAELGALRLVLLVGQYAIRWHLPELKGASLTDCVVQWEGVAARPGPICYVPLPHPSWRNNAWINRNPWFADRLLPWLRGEVARHLAG